MSKASFFFPTAAAIARTVDGGGSSTRHPHCSCDIRPNAAEKFITDALWSPSRTDGSGRANTCVAQMSILRTTGSGKQKLILCIR